MIMQILSYTPEQINQLPPSDRATFIQLVSPSLCRKLSFFITISAPEINVWSGLIVLYPCFLITVLVLGRALHLTHNITFAALYQSTDTPWVRNSFFACVISCCTVTSSCIVSLGRFGHKGDEVVHTPNNSRYASGQSLKVNKPHPNDPKEYDPNDTSSHQGIWLGCYHKSLETGSAHTTGSISSLVLSDNRGTGRMDRKASTYSALKTTATAAKR